MQSVAGNPPATVVRPDGSSPVQGTNQAETGAGLGSSPGPGLPAAQASGAGIVDLSALSVTAVNITAQAGKPFTKTVATVDDSDYTSDVLTATINWGDGTPDTNVAVTPDSNGNPVVQGTHTYARPSLYDVQVTVNDVTDGYTDTGTGQASVAPSLTVTAEPITARPGEFFSQAVATGKDPGAAFDQVTATINWGDGHVDQNAFVIGPDIYGNFEVSGSHTYDNQGPYPVTVTVTDVKTGLEVSDTGTATVDPPGVFSPSVTVPQMAGTAGGSTLLNAVVDWGVARANELTATIDWGDGHVDQNVQVQGPDSNGHFIVGKLHTYAGAGQFPVQVTVTDTVFGGQASGRNTARVTGTTGYPLTVTAGAIGPTAEQPFSGVVAFVDLGTSGVPVSALRATIDWGDGVQDANVPLTPTGAPGKYTVMGTHTFTGVGTQQFSIVVSNGGGVSASATGAAMVQPPPLPPPEFFWPFPTHLHHLRHHVRHHRRHH